MLLKHGDAKLKLKQIKELLHLAFENAKLEQTKRKQKPGKNLYNFLTVVQLPEQTPRQLPEADPMAEDWASKNTWFGQDRAMTFTAFEIHKDLVEKEGFDPKS